MACACAFAAETVTPEVPYVCETAEEASNMLARAEFKPSAEVATRLGEESDALRDYCSMFTLDVVPAADGK